MLAFSVGEYRDNEATAEFKEGGRKQEFTGPMAKIKRKEVKTNVTNNRTYP